MSRNMLNSPIDIIGLATTLSSISMTSMHGVFSSMEKTFGGMRCLTKEGQNNYNDNLDNLYKDSGVQLFDFLITQNEI